jgi:hypothetical protein
VKTWSIAISGVDAAQVGDDKRARMALNRFTARLAAELRSVAFRVDAIAILLDEQDVFHFRAAEAGRPKPQRKSKTLPRSKR